MARGIGLDRARIVAASLELADAEGLDSLSMRRISAELGVSAMAIYHHVDGKDELLDMIADESLRSLPPVALGLGAREAVLDWTCDFYRLLVDHPGLAQVIATRRLEGPVAAEVAGRLLQVLDRAGLDDEPAVELLVALVSFALGGSLYRTSRSLMAARRGGRRLPPETGPSPRVRERLATTVLDDAQFRSTLEHLLDGYLA